jgi:hypothetical protein
MTAAQKKAQANFKKAIAYRTKTGCSLKEAFAHVKGSVSGLDKVVKKGNKTTVLYTKKAKKKAAPKKKVSQGVLFGVKNKAAKKKAVSTHKDTKSHNVNIRVMSGLDKVTRKGKKTLVQYSRVSGLPNYNDPDMARELYLYSTNDSQLYFQQRKPILLNLGKKYKKGTFDVTKAAKLWRYFVDNSLQKYNKEFGSRNDKWYELMNVHDRNLLAYELAEETKAEFDLGNFEN